MVKPTSGLTSLFSQCSLSSCLKHAHHQPLVKPTALPQRRHAATYRRQRKMLNIAPAPSHGGSSMPSSSSGRSRSARQPLPEGDHIVFSPPPSAPNVFHTPPKFLPKDDIRRKLLEEENSLYGYGPNPAPSSAPPMPESSTASTDPTPSTPSGLAFPAPPASVSKPKSPMNPASSSSSTPTPPISATPAQQSQDGQRSSVTHTWPEGQQLPPAVRNPYQKSYHLTPEDINRIRQLRLQDEEKWTQSRLAAMFKCSPLFIALVVQSSKERRERIRQEHAENARNWKKRGQVSLKTREARRKRREAWGISS